MVETQGFKNISSATMTVNKESAVKSSKMKKNNNQYQCIIQESSQAKQS
jgi:hypothetical protein